MQLTAIRSVDQELVEAFAIGPEEWSAMMGDPEGSYQRADGATTLAHRHRSGLHYFATAQEMATAGPTHEQLQVHQMVSTCVMDVRSRGHACTVEIDLSRYGLSDSGPNIYCEAKGRRIAFVLHSESRALNEYEAMGQALTTAGLKCVWLVRSLREFRLLQSAAYFTLVRSGEISDEMIEEGISPSLPWLCAFPLLLCDNSSYGHNEERMAVSLPTKQGGQRRLLLPDFISGVLDGMLCYSRHQWTWRN